ncbi:MAG: hypothetical protein ACT4PE_17335 [Candidatus Eiseniibacteriota bacterium]
MTWRVGKDLRSTDPGMVPRIESAATVTACNSVLSPDCSVTRFLPSSFGAIRATSAGLAGSTGE